MADRANLDRVALDDAFQTACQRYTHGNGSSHAIAAAAIAAIGDDFATACATDPEGLIGVIDLAQQVWEGEELGKWMTTPQSRWGGLSPLQLCAADRADEVLDVLMKIELP